MADAIPMDAAGFERMSLWLRVLALLVAMTASACSTPSASIAGVRLSSLSLEGATLDFDVKVSNPTAAPIPLTKLDYGLASGATTFIDGSVPLDGVVPARGDRTVALPITVSFEQLKQVIGAVKPGTLVPYTASLALAAGSDNTAAQRWPISYSGKIPIPLPPKISVTQASWRSPSFSSIRGTIALAVSNPNEFAVTIRDLDYRVMLGDRSLVDGRASPLALGPRGDGTLKLDVDVPLQQIGPMLSKLMSSSAGSFSAAGNLRMSGEFGDIELPFATP